MDNIWSRVSTALETLLLMIHSLSQSLKLTLANPNGFRNNSSMPRDITEMKFWIIFNGYNHQDKFECQPRMKLGLDLKDIGFQKYTNDH